MEDILDEFGIWYVLAVVAAVGLAAAAFLLKWQTFGLPVWPLFAAVAVLGVLGMVARAVQ